MKMKNNHLQNITQKSEDLATRPTKLTGSTRVFRKGK